MYRRPTATPDGQRIREIRLEKVWTTSRLAKEARCSRKTVENAEGGKPLLQLTLSRIADALGVWYQDLLPGATSSARPSGPRSVQRRDVKITITIRIPPDAIDDSRHLGGLIFDLKHLLQDRETSVRVSGSSE